MREYDGLGYSTKSVKFKKDFSGYTSVKSIKAKVKGKSGNWFVMGIFYQYDDKSFGWIFDKICTGSETEFEITPYASGIKNLQVFFEPLDAGTYEVSDIFFMLKMTNFMRYYRKKLIFSILIHKIICNTKLSVPE